MLNAHEAVTEVTDASLVTDAPTNPAPPFDPRSSDVVDTLAEEAPYDELAALSLLRYSTRHDLRSAARYAEVLR